MERNTNIFIFDIFMRDWNMKCLRSCLVSLEYVLILNKMYISFGWTIHFDCIYFYYIYMCAMCINNIIIRAKFFCFGTKQHFSHK